MKLFTVTIFLLIFITQTFARDYKRFNLIYPKTSSELKLNSALNWSMDNFNAQSRLQEIKYLIINGNLDRAKILLNETSLSIDFTKQIQYRYHALISFLEGNYEHVINLLSKPIMIDFTIQSKVCFLKILSLIILERPKQVSKEWKTCREATLPHSDSNLTWMQTIVDLKTTDNKEYINSFFKNLDIDRYGKRYLRIYLKLALYLNQQSKIIPRFKFFGKAPLEDEIERELIGLNYYRNGNLQKAYKLLEGLSSANAEVFKGNLYLHQKKYEPAYAQFKLALNKKSNSQNALERLLPLSWKLNQWEEGIDFLKRMRINGKNSVEQDTLMSVFTSMANQHALANYYLKRVEKKTNLTAPIEVSQVKVLNALKQKKYLEIIDPAIKSCSGNDGINCWFIIALNSWDSLIEMLGKDTVIHKDLVQLSDKWRSSNITNPIVEEKLLDQKLIEELDNDLINLQ